MLESALLHLSPSSSLTADVAAKALLDKHSLPACSLRLRGMAKEARQGHSSHKELFHTWAEALRGIAQQSPGEI